MLYIFCVVYANYNADRANNSFSNNSLVNQVLSLVEKQKAQLSRAE